MFKRQTMKSYAEMTHSERLAALMRELSTPRGVPTALALIDQSRLEQADFERGLKIAMQVQEQAQAHAAPAAPDHPKKDVIGAAPAIESQKNEKAKRSTAGGTVASLAESYRTHPRSTYRTLRHKTRESYDGNIRRILNAAGGVKLADLKAEDIQRLYDGWSEGGAKLPMAHALITMLRVIVNFGATVLEDDDCIRIFVFLHRMALPGSKAPTERVALTEQQAVAIINAARKEYPSLALAQAFQFECKQLKQKDIIGEWVPIDEPGAPSEVIDETGKMKWLRGIRWNQIDDNLVLRHVTSQWRDQVEVDLKNAPLVMTELERMFGRPLTRASLPPSGPIINEERTERPYKTVQFRTKWRQLATALGIPKNVTNGSRPDDDENEERAAEVHAAARN